MDVQRMCMVICCVLKFCSIVVEHVFCHLLVSQGYRLVSLSIAQYRLVSLSIAYTLLVSLSAS